VLASPDEPERAEQLDLHLTFVALRTTADQGSDDRRMRLR
jgi:hypothetical protein